jgi:DNA-binding MurR/RpiR family transcriptional regulator
MSSSAKFDATNEGAAGPASIPIAVRLRAILPSLSRSEQRVAAEVLVNPREVAASTISELAERCGTSETTVIRFCRTLGLSGYPVLRLTLATEAGRADSAPARAVGGDIGPGDDLAQIVEKIAFADARAVEETAAQLDMASLQAVVDALVAAGRIDIYGVGASAFVAMDFQQKLHRIGQIAFAWSDTHIALTSAALLGRGDVAIGVSHTGVTTDTVDALAEARRRGATTVALTNFPRSPITDVADHVLTTAARETTFRSGAMASRLAQLTLVDFLFVGVAQQTYAETRVALEATLDAVSGHRLKPDRGRNDGRRA